ncbi:hypothetical protein FQA39_LY16251 [Lamprigera yunnana]|nr:hypothetical protein FQA39_LY16251 [Lamprigera yunnana]
MKMLLLLSALLTINVCSGANKPSVVIVGAGPAGIAAASRLLQNNIDDVTILEAEDRIGGRIFSVKLGGNYVDLGAEWCHGEENNVVFDLVKNLNVLRSPKDDFYKAFHSKNKIVEPSVAEEIFNLTQTLYSANATGVSGSLGDHLTKKYNEEISKWENDQEKFSLGGDFIHLFEKYVLGYEGAFSWYDVAADNDYEESPGNQQLHWNGHGYKTILNVLMNSTQSFPILLKKEVEKIIWDTDFNKTLVNCTDGTSYVTDHVIFTPSLGVLKEQHLTLFKPTLPVEKINAIQNLGFGAVFKVFMLFSKRWWDNNLSGYVFVWDKNGLDVNNFPPKFVQNGTTWITSIASILAVEHNYDILEVWFVGNSIPIIENISDDTLVDGIMYLLSNFSVCKQEDLTRPREIKRYNFASKRLVDFPFFFKMKLLLFFVFAVNGVFGDAAKNRIVGGFPAQYGQFPYQASLQDRWNGHFCGGAIVSQQWVVTSAGCIYNKNSQNMGVVVGTIYLTGTTPLAVSKIIWHEYYNPSDYNNNIGMDSNVSCLDGAKTSISSPTYSTNLLYTTLKALTLRDCINAYPGNNINNNHVCALEYGRGGCDGDNGNPLVANNLLIGILSWGIPCATGKPDVFSNIATYNNWIIFITNNF